MLSTLFHRSVMSLALFVGVTGAGLTHASDTKPVIRDVVELFTSQGCSSCPPADKFAGELVNEDGVLVLAWHVDYWDYLGWKDTLSLKDATRRQKTYAMTLGNRRLVTPQFVINGAHSVEGARVTKVWAALEGSDVAGGAQASIRHDKGRILIELTDMAAPVTDTLVELVYIQPKTEVVIERGENTGKTITYHNAVRSVERLGIWSGDDKTITLPMSVSETHNGADCVVIVRDISGDNPTERILAAALLPADMLN